MKIINAKEEIKIINLNDSGIVKFVWTGKGHKDLELYINWCGQEEFADIFDFDNIDMKMICQNVIEFNLRADFKDLSMGPLEIWEFNYKIIESRKYNITKQKKYYNICFDLVTNSNNFLKIICDNFYFMIDEKSQIL